MRQHYTSSILLFSFIVGLVGHQGLQAFTPAQAVTSVDELTDVQTSHWAYEALADLVEKYDVVEGYPDKTFRGTKTLNRWEMASLLDNVTRQFGKQIAMLGAEKANKADVEMLSRLQEEFRSELGALESRHCELELRAEAIEAKNEEQDTRLSLLERTSVHGDMTFGLLSDFGGNGTGRSNDGILDGTSAVGRLRLTIDVPVRDDNPDSKLGAGIISTRFIGAFGKYARIGSYGGNEGADYPFSIYSRISADVSSMNEGWFNGGANPGLVGGGNIRPNLYLESAFYRQHIKHGVPLLTDWSLGLKKTTNPKWQTTGDLYAGLVRWWDLFDVSPYRGNEQTQFQNNAFINIPGIAVNYPMPMIGYQWHQGLGQNASMDISAAVGSMAVGSLLDTLNVTYEAKLNYNTAFLGDNFAKPGSVYLGAYHIRDAGNVEYKDGLGYFPLTNRSGNTYARFLQDTTANAFYAGWNQEWWKGIGTSVGYLVNNTSNEIGALTTLQPGPGAVIAAARQSFSSVLSIPMSILFKGKRKDDNLGLGYAFIDIAEDDLIEGSEFKDAIEHVFEAYYRMQLTPSMAVIPNVQLIFNGLGMEANEVTAAIGLRMSCSF